MTRITRLLFLTAAGLVLGAVALSCTLAWLAPDAEERLHPRAASFGARLEEALSLHEQALASGGAARETHMRRLANLVAALRSEVEMAGDAGLRIAAERLPRDLSRPRPEQAAELRLARDIASAAALSRHGGPETAALVLARRLEALTTGALVLAASLLTTGLYALRRAERRSAEERRRLDELLAAPGEVGDLGERVARLRGKADRLAERTDRAVMGRLSLAEAVASYEAAQERLHAAQDELTERLREARGEIERLKVASMLDELTGALKYPYMVHRIRDLLRELLDGGPSFCLLELDLDNFKDINDTYGHAAGDDALREFARLLRESSREEDLVIRKSGDEFFVLAPRTRLEAALALGERLRSAVNSHTVLSTSAAGDRYEFPLAASVGVLDASDADIAMLRTIPDPDMAVREVISYVDAALYRAKHAGKNCVRGYEAGLRVVDLRQGDAPPDLSRINRLVPSRYPHLEARARARVDALLDEVSELLFPKRRSAGE